MLCEDEDSDQADASTCQEISMMPKVTNNKRQDFLKYNHQEKKNQS
jgi:hypothetical protein